MLSCALPASRNVDAVPPTSSYLLSAPFVALGGLSPNEMEIAKVGVKASAEPDVPSSVQELFIHGWGTCGWGNGKSPPPVLMSSQSQGRSFPEYTIGLVRQMPCVKQGYGVLWHWRHGLLACSQCSWPHMRNAKLGPRTERNCCLTWQLGNICSWFQLLFSFKRNEMEIAKVCVLYYYIYWAVLFLVHRNFG